MKLDKTDIDILRILQEDGRITNKELAKSIGISPPPALERVKKLEKSGVIKKYVALVEPLLVGIQVLSFVEVTLSPHTQDAVKEFVEAVSKVDEILEFHHITGDADFLLKIAVPNMSVYKEIMYEKLTELPHIQHLKTMIVMSTYKSKTSYVIK